MKCILKISSGARSSSFGRQNFVWLSPACVAAAWRGNDRVEPDCLPRSRLFAGQLAKGGKTAGFNVALYGLRSKRNWGCGDFTDLRALVDWSMREVGFSFIGLNPLHALHNRTPYNTSPYLPLSLYYKNLIYLDIENVPEFATSSSASASLSVGRDSVQIENLRHAQFVEYQEVDSLKKQFLKILHRGISQFARTRLGPVRGLLLSIASTKAICCRNLRSTARLTKFFTNKMATAGLGTIGRLSTRSPDSAESLAFAKEHAVTVEFYKYIQFVINEQLAAAQTIRQR